MILVYLGNNKSYRSLNISSFGFFKMLRLVCKNGKDMYFQSQLGIRFQDLKYVPQEKANLLF